jgi:hypothetical protein
MPEDNRGTGMDLDALERLEAGELFGVLDHDHPDFPFYVSFDDEIAHEYDDAIDRLVDEVAELPDVAHAVRDDREVLLVGGSIDGTALAAWLAAWWRSELLQQPSPERATETSPSASRSRRFWSRRRRDS